MAQKSLFWPISWIYCRKPNFLKYFCHRIVFTFTFQIYFRLPPHVFFSLRYTGCPILNNTLIYLRNGALNKKMFQTKVVWLEGGHQTVAMIWPWRVIWRSREGHFNFFKWYTLYIFAHSCSLSRELSKTL